MKKRLLILFSLLTLVLTGLLVDCYLKLLDASSSIEAGVVGEMWLQGQRDFLMRLPALMRQAGNREELLKLLHSEYPDVAVTKSEGGIAFPPLLLQFNEAGNRLENIREMSKEEVWTAAADTDDSTHDAGEKK